jgi:hypothetical protein
MEAFKMASKKKKKPEDEYETEAFDEEKYQDDEDRFY